MARRPTLGNLGLNPFGGAGVSFSAFDIAGSNRESSLILERVEIQWKNGKISNDAYLAALDAYAKTLDANTTQQLNAFQNIAELKYRFERNVLVDDVDNGRKTVANLLEYDTRKLVGINQQSEEYRQRLSVLQSTQNRYFQDAEDDVVERYQDGKMTTAQLSTWYHGQLTGGTFAKNPDLIKALNKRIADLSDRVVEERDSKVIGDYQQGKSTPKDFLTYAVAARARYVAGTTAYDDWTGRIEQAQDSQAETGLMYRYDLAQKYAQLAAFVKTNSGGIQGGSAGTAPHPLKGRTSKRIVLGADGKWHTVITHTGGGMSKGSAATGPTKLQQQAYKKRQIEVADAKKQMKEIARKASSVGGFVTTQQALTFYTRQLGRFAKGSSEWYAVQGKLDSLHDRQHAETVLRREGIKISYPGVTAASGGGGGTAKASTSSGGGGSSTVAATSRAAAPKSDTGDVAQEAFMKAIAHVESGGRYNAVNKKSGAYGKYQIMPSNWPGWAAKYLGNSGAPMSPENQEKVATGKMKDLYRWLGDWRAVAHWWLTGGSDKNVHRDPGRWSASSTRYVDSVMAGLGKAKTSNSPLARAATPTVTRAGAGSPKPPVRAPTGSAAAAYAPAAAARTPGVPVATDKKPLLVVTGVMTYAGGRGSHGTTGPPPHSIRKATSFPAGLDGEAFKKFYAQYAEAYASGREEFTVSGPGGGVHYFIGDDPQERRDAMLRLDQMRVDLFKTRLHAYAGTPSEVAAGNQFDDAVEDAAKHELMALDTTGPRALNPGPAKDAGALASGLRLLDDTKKAIDTHIQLADAAFKRGDLTAAYSHLQSAGAIRSSAASTLGQYSSIVAARIAAIEGHYGVTPGSASPGKSFNTDLARLNGFDIELEELLTKTDEQVGELRKIVAKDAAGNPLFDSRGIDGQLILDPKYIWRIGAGGKVEAELAPAAGFDTSGRQKRDMPDSVAVDFKTGNTTIKAYTKYKVGTVGYILDAGGKRVPISGKVVSFVDAVGKEQMFVENPFRPGVWSTSQIIYKPPASFKSITATGGGVAFAFDSGRNDGVSYKMKLDPATGTYSLFRSTTGGGVFGADAVVDEEMGTVGVDFAGEAFSQAGWSRDFTGLTADDLFMAQLDAPALGFSGASEYKKWKSGFKSPFDMPSPRAALPPSRAPAAKAGLRPDGSPIMPAGLSLGEGGAADRPETSYAAARSLGLTLGPGGVADRWFDDQRAASRTVPRAPLPLPPVRGPGPSKPGARPIAKVAPPTPAEAAQSDRESLRAMPKPVPKLVIKPPPRRPAPKPVRAPASKPTAARRTPVPPAPKYKPPELAPARGPARKKL